MTTYETDQSNESFISSPDDFSLPHSQGRVQKFRNIKSLFAGPAQFKKYYECNMLHVLKVFSKTMYDNVLGLYNCLDTSTQTACSEETWVKHDKIGKFYI